MKKRGLKIHTVDGGIHSFVIPEIDQDQIDKLVKDAELAQVISLISGDHREIFVRQNIVKIVIETPKEGEE